jgi:hypothetical protein
VVDLLDPSRPSSAQHQNSPTKKFCLSSAGPAQDVLVLTSQCKRVAQRAVTQPCQRGRPQPSLKCSTPKLPNKKFFCLSSRRADTIYFINAVSLRGLLDYELILLLCERWNLLVFRFTRPGPAQKEKYLAKLFASCFACPCLRLNDA